MTMLDEDRIERIVGGLDSMTARGLLGTQEAADLTARVQRLSQPSPAAPGGAAPTTAVMPLRE